MPWGIPSLGAASGQRMDDDSDEDDDDTPPPGKLPPAQGAAGAGKRKAQVALEVGGGKMASAQWRRQYGESCDSNLFHF